MCLWVGLVVASVNFLPEPLGSMLGSVGASPSNGKSLPGHASMSADERACCAREAESLYGPKYGSALFFVVSLSIITYFIIAAIGFMTASASRPSFMTSDAESYSRRVAFRGPACESVMWF